MRTLQIYFSNRLLIVSAFWQTIEKDGSGFHYHADDALGSTLNFDVARRGKMPAYEFGVIQLSAQPYCFTFVQSRA